MKTTSAILPVRFTAAALVLLIASAAAAQDTGAPAATGPEAGALPAVSAAAPASALTDAPNGAAVTNPHKMLGGLNGGSLGSPTATRGNPQPGTSTAIPTLNPAPVFPLGNPTGAGNWIGDTGIEGQCDPSVSFEDCALIAEELKNDDAAVPAAGLDEAEVLDADAAAK